jgi:enoyl-CoA hydratase
MSDPSILLEVSGRVATITLAREHRRNALDNEALERLRSTFEELRQKNVTVAVIVGQGLKAFCAGSDLKALAAYSEPEAHHHTHLFLSCMETIDEFPCATIAAIEGYCFGGGLELALACDYRIASKEAKFGFPEIKVGALPSGGGTVRAPRAIGLTRAREMLLFGFEIDAQKALDWGLISETAPAGAALETALAMARRYADKVDPATVALLKHILIGGYGSSTRTGQTLAYLADYALVQSESFKRGVRGFAGKGSSSSS